MSADRPTARCGVLGSPIGHSLSPVLHRAAYAELGLDWAYDAHDVTVETLPGFIAGLTPEWRGLSLTMPLKREVIACCDRVESLGAMLESINTVVIGGDGMLVGHNTDVVGFVRAVRTVTMRPLETAVVVGAGATAASALAALGQLGVHQVTIAARTPTKAARLVALGQPLGLHIEVVPLAAYTARASDIVISTIPAEAQPPVAAALAASGTIVFDVIYHPAATPLLAAAASTAATGIAGFELLLHQAARQVELMTGVRAAPVEAMRAAGLAELGNR